jgi:hypothetical protein
MSNFVQIGGSDYVINLDHVAYVEKDYGDTWSERSKVGIVFAGLNDTEPRAIVLIGDDAERFMSMLNQQAIKW